MQQEKKYWRDLLNADDADFTIGPQEYVNCENFRFGTTFLAEGAVNFLEAIGSTILKPNADLPDREATFTLGWAYDEPNKRFVYMVWDEFVHHGVFLYDLTTDAVYTLLLDAQVTGGLNLDRFHLIHSAFIENGNVYWTDNLNEPRRFNINAAINMNYPGTFPSVSAYTSPLTQSNICWIRRQPSLPVSFVKLHDGGIVYNFIKDEAFFFTWRYTYRDFEVSKLADFSLLANYNLSTDNFNSILITIPFAEKIDQEVLIVDLVAYYINGNAAFVIRSWDKRIAADNAAIAFHNLGITPLTYFFINDTTGDPIDLIYFNTQFDSVPYLAQSVAVAKNRSFMGNYTIGYDTTVITSLIAVANTQSGGSLNASWVIVSWFNPSFGIIATHYYIYIPGYGYYDVAPQPVGPPPFPASEDFVINLTIVSVDDTPTFIAYLETVFPNPPDTPIVFYNQAPVTITSGPTPVLPAGSKVFKTDAHYNVSINFKDFAGRRNGYLTTSTLLVSVPDRVYNQIEFIVGIFWSLSNVNAVNEIPVWADEYSINITKCGRTNFFLQLRGTAGASYATKDSDGNYLFTTTTWSPTLAGCAFDITALDSYSMGYLFEAGSGDIVKIWLNDGLPPHDLVIVAQVGNWIVTELASLGTLDNTTKFLFEIFTPKKPDIDEPTFQVCQMYKVSNPGTASRQYSVTTGQIMGDVTLVQRNDGASNYLAETMSPNDKFYKNWNTDAARPQFKILLGATNRQSSIAFSNTFLAGTAVNGLSTYDALDVKDISPDYGPIQKLQLTSKVQRTGSIMLAVCPGQTASCYLSENTLISNLGDAVVAQSNDVIGTVNQLKGAFGTINPESVIEWKGNVYWVDILNGKVIQYADNGLFPISNYKMSKYWKLFSEVYNSLTPQQIEGLGSRPGIASGIDPQNAELLFSVPLVLLTPPLGYLPDYPSTAYPFDIWDGQEKTIVYKLNVEPNRWQGAYRFRPECFAYCENKLFSFRSARLWEHNDESTFCNFYTVQEQPRIMFVANQVPNRPKSYNNVSVESNQAPTFTYFMSIYPYVQSSDLVDFDYENKEGIFYAAIYRDKLSPQFNNNYALALISGDKMRTTALRVMVEFAGGSQIVQLKFVNLGYSVSIGHTI